MNATSTPTNDGASLPPSGMTDEEYRTRAKQMVDYIVEYLQTIRERRVYPGVQPGFLRELVPADAPRSPEKWEDIVADIERVIMPGIVHWQSPHMHGYFACSQSYPGLIADMLANSLSCLTVLWASCPIGTELEVIVVDWLGKMLGLPECFLQGNSNLPAQGAGCIQNTGSDCTFNALVTARTRAINRVKSSSLFSEVDQAAVNGRLVAYCSDQAHSSVQKAAQVGLLTLRTLPTDSSFSLSLVTLQQAIHNDREKGLIPFFVCVTLGSTGSCSFDNLQEIGPICEREKLWCHVDAAYAGSAFICPEFRHFLEGVEFADSLFLNASKMLMVHYDCSVMWVKDAKEFQETFKVSAVYLENDHSDSAVNFMHWRVGTSRGFNALKLWFVLRAFGVEGLQKHVRKHVALAASFEDLVKADPRFEVIAPRHLGLVVFRLVGPNDLTKKLLTRLNLQGQVHMVPALLKEKYVIRFAVTSQFTTDEDISRDWKIINDVADTLLQQKAHELAS